jgi:MoxR-like ATPase
VAIRQAHAPAGLLRALGIVGWGHLEPVILAALATEAPLLLIGPHGSAKTLVLTKLAALLGLEHRHYNASLLNFDDLVGFPVPENGRLVYLQTPATIWDAESVLFDEVSRCRPELQNKLFPIVHERVVQGVALSRLRYRWAAMNPPPSADAAAGVADYAGAEPLDVALADRFAFIVSVPGLGDLDRQDQLAVLSSRPEDTGDCNASAASNATLAPTLERIREAIERIGGAVQDAAAEYVQIALQKLAEGGHRESTRRAVQLTRNIVAISAVLDVEASRLPASPATGSAVEDAFFTAFRHSLPDAAWGAPIAQVKVLAAHRAAWQLAKPHVDRHVKAILLEPDPVRRIALALAAPAPTMPSSDAGQVVAECFSSLSRLARLATAAVLGPRLARRPDLPAACVEPVGRDYALLARQAPEKITVRNGGADWRRKLLSSDLPRLSRTTARGRALTNAAIVLMQEDQPFELDALEAAYDDALSALEETEIDRTMGSGAAEGTAHPLG